MARAVNQIEMAISVKKAPAKSTEEVSTDCSERPNSICDIREEGPGPANTIDPALIS